MSRRTARRPAARRTAPPPLFARITSWRYLPDLAGFALIALGLVALLALLRPEGTVATPMGVRLQLALGWMAGLAPAWLIFLGAMVISHRISPRPWPWSKLAAVVLASLALLGLATLEADRQGAPLVVGNGGGVAGRYLVDTLSGWFGRPSAFALLMVVLGSTGLVLSGATPGQLARGLARAAQAGHRAAGAVRALGRPRLRINPDQPRPARVTSAMRSQPPRPADEPTGLDVRPVAPTPRPDGSWKTPPLSLFQSRKAAEPVAAELREQARIIEETLASFNIEVRVLEANQGPAVTQFGLEPAVGVPVSRVQARLNDLALRLGASPIRIEAPVPGRRMVGIEVPNSSISVVNLRDVLESTTFERTKLRIPLPLGKDIAGKPRVTDLARMPHLLIAGATGSGKSVCINSIVASLLSQFTPDDLQLMMIDPKMVELIAYNGVPHLRMPVVTDMDRVVGTLKWAIQEMDRRYKLFAGHSARNIDGYNRAVRDQPDQRALPYLVIIIDELADLMMLAPDEVERTITRLAQLARATGIHLVLATQRPSVDVITGIIKANFPTRIAFAVTSQVDSRVILDTVGAERLLGRGDMLFLPPDASQPIRLQGTYVSDQEIEALVSYWKGLGSPQYDEAELADIDALGHADEPDGGDLFDRAVEVAERTGRISVSLLQRRLGIGYPRAARLMDLLEERGVVGASEDGRSREVLSQPRRD